MLKQTKAITLIALIITIIVLLILAGVTINMVLGENGIVNKSKTSVGKYENAQEKEEIELSKASNEIDIASFRDANAEIEALRLEFDAKITDLQTQITALQGMSGANNMILLKRDVACTSVDLDANSWASVQSINLNSYGTGKAIITFSAYIDSNISGKNLQLQLKCNNQLISTDGDFTDNNGSWKRVSTFGIIDYTPTTNIGMQIYCPGGKPYYMYQILIIPNSTIDNN